MKYTANGTNSKTFINALGKAKRELKKVDYDEYQVNDIIEIVSHEYYLNSEEKEALKEKVEKFVKKMNDIYSLPFDEFEKYIEKKYSNK